MASRKMWFSVASAAMIILAARVLPAAVVGDAVAGLVSVCAIYVGGNTATKWVLGRAPGLAPKPDQPAEPKPAGA